MPEFLWLSTRCNGDSVHAPVTDHHRHRHGRPAHGERYLLSGAGSRATSGGCQKLLEILKREIVITRYAERLSIAIKNPGVVVSVSHPLAVPRIVHGELPDFTNFLA